ncbi:unnamed protein product [Blepharisma stoltei]|uniref:Lipid-binding serum glycoprotein C-terminal domain-containing protein n=1 Tax=Blepharisma stoltei TaxID=1481888 RepID=A0AAU9IWD9_9CILI|nr:unnamed protein product [Blepharisma stoltei]
MLWNFSIISITIILTAAINPGLIFSRNMNDITTYIKELLPNMFLGISSGKLSPIFYNSYDGFREITMNITNIYLVNAKVIPQDTVIQLTSPSYLYVLFHDFQGNISFDYQELGFAINNTGHGNAVMNDAQLYFNLSLFEINSIPQVKMEYLILNVTSLDLNLPLNQKVQDTIEQNLVSLLQTHANAAFASSFESQINFFFQHFNYYPRLVFGVPFVVDISWANNEVIVSDEYMAFVYNGTILPSKGNAQLISEIAPPVEMPTRNLDPKSINNTQIFMSEYMINSYFWAIWTAYPNFLVSSFPASFNIQLVSNSGYFPEVYSHFGTTPMQINITYGSIPYIKSIPNLGLQGNLIVNANVMAMDKDEFISAFNATVQLQYLINVYIDGNYYLKGYPLRLKIISIDIVNSNVDAVSHYYLGRLIFDLFQNLANTNSYYFFPQIRLPYMLGTIFSNFHVRYMQGYLEVDYATVDVDSDNSDLINNYL